MEMQTRVDGKQVHGVIQAKVTEFERADLKAGQNDEDNDEMDDNDGAAVSGIGKEDG
jgi:hypothetical protein